MRFLFGIIIIILSRRSESNSRSSFFFFFFFHFFFFFGALSDVQFLHPVLLFLCNDDSKKKKKNAHTGSRSRSVIIKKSVHSGTVPLYCNTGALVDCAVFMHFFYTGEKRDTIANQKNKKKNSKGVFVLDSERYEVLIMVHNFFLFFCKRLFYFVRSINTA